MHHNELSLLPENTGRKGERHYGFKWQRARIHQLRSRYHYSALDKKSFYQVRQGRSWSSNYKFLSPPSPSPSTRFRIFKITFKILNYIKLQKLHPISKITFNLQNYIQFSELHLIFQIAFNFPNCFQFSKQHPNLFLTILQILTIFYGIQFVQFFSSILALYFSLFHLLFPSIPIVSTIYWLKRSLSFHFRANVFLLSTDRPVGQ
jgi:hypothetical protein